MKCLLTALVICGLAVNLSAEAITILNPNFDAQVLALAHLLAFRGEI
jgi:hypothetical protein